MLSFKRIIKVTFILAALGVLVLFSLYMSMRSDLPSVELLKDIQWQTPMQIYSADNKLISQFGEKKRYPLTLEEVPQQLIDAILATEDDRFYLHFGVDPIGMSRAILGQLTGNDKGGASTITMQVARNFFLTREQTYIRKLREIFISFHIESLLTKDEILMLYINKIELGHRSFGFAAAAQVYYGKDLNDLTLAQIAVLAGLPKAPSTLNPIRSKKRAKNRRAVVLKRMLVSNYISDEQYKEALNAPMTGKHHGAQIELNAPYVAEMAHQEMLDRFGAEKAYNSGFKVFTTITADLQLAAQRAVIENLLNYDQRHGYRGAVKHLRLPSIPDEDSQTDSAVVDADLLPATQALTDTEIASAIASTTSYQFLIPAVVTEVQEQSVVITLKNQQQAIIPWEGMSWARAFISDERQDTEPQLASDILNYGDVILVVQTPEGSYRLSQLPDVSAALVSISPDDGAIKAAVGGFSFKQSQFNRVTQAKRQVGSNIKPFIYSAALEKGLTLASLVNDAPINQWDRSTGVVWRPKNSPPTYDGTIRVRLALAQSKNVIAVRLLRSVGLDNIIDYLSLFGFVPDELPRNESLALGSASLTPLELVTGFATFANGGFLVEPYLIDRIEDSFGNVIYQATPKLACEECDNLIASLTETKQKDEKLTEELALPSFLNDLPNSVTNDSLPTQESAIDNETNESQLAFEKAPRVISEQNAFLIGQALNSVIWGADWNIKPYWQGTGFRARKLKRRDIAGKTGTTNQSKDAWFSGFTRRLVTTSWIGFDDHQRNLGVTRYNNNLPKNQITGSEFGAKSAQPAWIKFMASALPTLEEESFVPPEGIVSVRIDKATGKLTTKTDRSSEFEYFIQGTEPTEYVTEDNSGDILDGGDINEDELF